MTIISSHSAHIKFSLSSWGLSPFVRNSVWIGGLSLANTNWLIYAEQPAMMRYTALKTEAQAKMYVFLLSTLKCIK